MSVLKLLYWSALACVLYPYLIYPLLIGIRAKFRPNFHGRGRAADGLPSVSVILVVRNEAGRIFERLGGLAKQIHDLGLLGEIVVVSDGSTDRTVPIAQAFDGQIVPVKVVELPENLGKAAALGHGAEAAHNTILAFADARQTWDADALAKLLENFQDANVGAVSGELFVRSSEGTMSAIGLYWRFEKWLRRCESAVWSTVGLTGSVCAVRSELFQPIPQGIVLDDVYWPLHVAMRGYRVVFDTRAHAFDRLPDRLHDELKRKVRTLSGNFQLISALPKSLLPWKNPVWFALISHKLSRLIVPWAALVVIALGLEFGGPIYLGTAAAGLVLIGLGLLGLHPSLAKRSRGLAASASFLALNFAAWLAFWVWISGRTSRSWIRVDYRDECQEQVAKSMEYASR